ncbi:MAG: hypothetical protein JXR84_27850 [Anaerolineae bacterium]|nr:hypothetical protein [Anaerolineae bacterium]
MEGISPDLHNRLTGTLLRCGPFDSNAALCITFIAELCQDERLKVRSTQWHFCDALKVGYGVIVQEDALPGRDLPNL